MTNGLAWILLVLFILLAFEVVGEVINIIMVLLRHSLEAVG